MKALGEILRPEFINRVDEVICFRQLTQENFRAIGEIMLRELQQSLQERGMALRWDQNVLDFLTKKSYSVQYGARNLRRTIQKEIEDPLALQLLNRAEGPCSAAVRVEDGRLAVSVPET